jgi:hypothetical protein
MFFNAISSPNSLKLSLKLIEFFNLWIITSFLFSFIQLLWKLHRNQSILRISKIDLIDKISKSIYWFIYFIFINILSLFYLLKNVLLIEWSIYYFFLQFKLFLNSLFYCNSCSLIKDFIDNHCCYLKLKHFEEAYRDFIAILFFPYHYGLKFICAYPKIV